MLAQTLRPLRGRIPVRPLGRVSRHYNGQSQGTGSHKTYFQEPPQTQPKRRWRTIPFLVGLAGGLYVGSMWLGPALTLSGIPPDMLPLLLESGGNEKTGILARAIEADASARSVNVVDLDIARARLNNGAMTYLTPVAVAHGCQLGSNIPCEDYMTSGIYNMVNDPTKDWAFWAVFDGHAGPNTAHLLFETLPSLVGGRLRDAKCMDRVYTPNDIAIVNVIKRAFLDFDADILHLGRREIAHGENNLAHTVASLAPSSSGSCALMAIFDPLRSILRVANTGDSRAVLGRWDDASGKYVAHALSVDQTGFNQEEVHRLQREHPGESPVDPETGRVHGIAVSRAFGDARWKWPNDVSKTVFEKFWGPRPRSDDMIKTPPYLTAEPEVMETMVQTGEHSDFVIMASDGLWDNMSSEDAVACVQMWLDKFHPTDYTTKPEPRSSPKKREKPQLAPDVRDFAPYPTEDDDTYWDEIEGTMKWRVSPKHFTVEDGNCGVHLIRNALGGNRPNLFRGLMTIQPPYSRNVRDDISVQVIFFGVDGKPLIRQMGKKVE